MANTKKRGIMKLLSAMLAATITVSSAYTVLPVTAAAEADTDIVIEEIDEKEAGTTSLEWDGTIASGFAGGSGTENDPFQISNGEELRYLSYMVNNGTYYEGKYFVLTQNILLNDDVADEPNTWVPIGEGSSDFFHGTFDGDGHQVIGIYINDTSSTNDDRGLFGKIGSSGVVKNVGVTKGRINGYGDNVGGICGYNWGRISGCYNLNRITSSTSSDPYGGICGGNDGVIENCYNSGELNITGSDKNYDIGGVCGYNSGTISECYNTGRVYTTGSTYSVGGVCGHNYATIKDCYNLGEVNGYWSVGGVCGQNDGGTVKDSFNKGEVTGRDANTGGVCGFSGSSSATDTILRCYNLGSVKGTYNVSGYGITGGVCGALEGYLIKQCYNFGTVQCYNFGTVDAYYHTGGVCGRIRKGEVRESFNAGTVDGYRYVGGVAGSLDQNAIIKNCYNIADISGSDCVGGVWGYSYNSSSNEMANCYNTGDVTGSSELYPVGYNNGQISNVYYDSNECECSSTNNSAWAKTTKQLTASTAISDLGFDSGLWSKTANTDSYWYYPDLANINGDQPRVMAKFIVSGLTATSKANSAILKWSAHPNATSYRVYRATSLTGAKTMLKAVTTTTYTDTAVTPGNTYYYFVAPYNSTTSMLGDYSESAKAVIPSALAAPVISSAVNNNGKITLSWSKISDATSYRVYRATSTTGAKTLLKAVTATTYTDTTAVLGTTYYYYVAAYDSITGRLSNYSTGKSVKAAASLTAPTISTITTDQGVVKLTWNKVTGATSYRIYRANSSTGAKTLLKAVTSTTYTDTSATVDKTYYYYVAAYSSTTGALSSYSAGKSIKVLAGISAPTISSATGTNGKVTLAWSKISDATSYRVFRATSATGAKTLLKAVTTTTFTDTTATVGNTYYYFVRAYDSATGRLSGYSAGKSVTVKAGIATPTITSVATGNGKVQLTWSTVTGATSYRVYRANTATGARTLLKAVTSNTYTDTAVSSGSTYYYFVAAYNSTTGSLSSYSTAKGVIV